MGITNTILLITGSFVTIIGITAFFNPNLARWINAPGTPTIKAIICTISGVVIILIGLLVPLPG